MATKKRIYKAKICGHNVAHFYSKRCPNCYHKYQSALLKGRPKSKDHIAKLSGKHNGNWKGGTIIHKKSGYILIKNHQHPFAQKNGYVFEHRIIMENKLGRYLERNEEVHHINHIKTDNRIENLMLFSSHSDHIAFEHKNGDR